MLVAVAAIVAFLGRRAPPPSTAADDEEIDRAELEEAEREVRDMEGDDKGKPTDDVVGDDWGPGAGRTPLG